MMKRSFVFLSILLGLSLIATLAMAEIKIPGRTKFLVNDYAGVLSAETKARLEKLLRGVRDTDFIGTEIEVSTFKTLDGASFEDFIREYARKWRMPMLIESYHRIHVVVIVDDHKMRIGVGRSLDNVITKADTNKIMRDMVAEFGSKGYESGIIKGVDAIIGFLKKGNMPKIYTFAYVRRLFMALILIISVLVIVFLARRKF